MTDDSFISQTSSYTLAHLLQYKYETKKEGESMFKRNSFADTSSCSGVGLNIFTCKELDMIHHSTLEVLKKTGCFIESGEARKILGDAGADVEHEAKIVRFPEWLVEESIRTAPKQLLLYGRDDKNNLVVEANRVYISTFGQAVDIQDLDTGEYRHSTKQDVAEQCLLTDALPEIDICERALTAGDCPNEVAPLHEAEVLFANTTKHAVFGPGNGYRAEKIIDMAASVVGGHNSLKEKPILTINCCPTSPLKLVEHVCNAIMVSAKHGVPCNILSMVLAGASGPTKLAGSLVVYNAEILAGIILHQCANKGAPVIYGGSSMVFDMHHLTTPMGSPEVALLNAAAPKIAQFYGLPSWVAGG